jgi:hypothetical protein
MAGAVAQYIFAALLALLSAQAAMPSANIVSAAGIVWCAESDQEKAPDEVPKVGVCRSAQPPKSSYKSRTDPEPHSAVLFQRPPPVASLF